MDVKQQWPSAEEIFRLLGGRQHDSRSDLFSEILIFGAGLLVGAGLAALLTPVPGSELRGEVNQLLKEVGDRLKAGEGSSNIRQSTRPDEQARG